MPIRYLDRIPGDRTTVLQRMREAALRLVDHEGDGSASNYPTPCIHSWEHGGFIVHYHRLTPDSELLRRTARTFWGSPPDTAGVGIQHVVELYCGGILTSFGWRGNGPIEYGRQQRGPFEFALLEAADRPFELPRGYASASFAPVARSRVKLPADVSRRCEAWRLKAPLSFSIAGYRSAMHIQMDPGMGFPDLLEVVRDLHDLGRQEDGCEAGASLPVMSFRLYAWLTRGKVDITAGKRADLDYWISSRGGVEAAARLLLLFDRHRRMTSASGVRRLIPSRLEPLCVVGPAA